MRLLKIIFFVFIIYLVRRFIQVYRAMKKIQEAQANGQTFDQTFQKRPSPRATDANTINADFKVVD